MVKISQDELKLTLQFSHLYPPITQATHWLDKETWEVETEQQADDAWLPEDGSC